MQKQPIDQFEFYPPFTGFPKESILFLRKLKKNNNRNWFIKNKEDYEEFVKLPMQSLITELHPHVVQFSTDFEVHPKKSLFRIYRDVRFSSDKRPYKTHIAAHFVKRGKPKGLEGLGYYIHIEPGEIFLGAGIYIPSSDQLKRIRKAIVEREKEFLKLIKNQSIRKLYGNISGEKLKRIPQGFDPDHPMAEWLKHKQFFLGTTWPEKKCHTRKFVSEVSKAMKVASPLVQFLEDALN